MKKSRTVDRPTAVESPRHLATRRGVKELSVAVAASILTSAYFILLDGVTYRELGPDYLDRREPGTIARRLAKRSEALGFTVDLRPAA